MDRAKLDKWFERGILALVLAILIYGPLATGAVLTGDFLVLQGLTLGVMLLWGLRLWLSPKPQILWAPICWIVIVFVAYAIGRYLTADLEYVARRELLRILVYAVLFFAILNNLHRQETTRIISVTLIVLAMGISCYAIYQYVTGSDRVWNYISPYKGRGGGTYICPNDLAGFLELLLPLAMAYTLVGRCKPLTRILLGYAAIVMMAGLGATVSRAGWMACGLSLLALFGVLVTHRNYRLPAALFLLVLLTAGVFFTLKTNPLEKRFQDRPTGEGVDTSDVIVRLDLWKAAAQMWMDHPWFGVGPGHYDYRFRAYRPPSMQMRPLRAHNDYLNTLADWGIVGATIIAVGWAALLAGLFMTWKSVRRSEREFKSNYSDKFAFVLGASCGLLAILLHEIVDFNLQVPANAILTVCLMAILTSHLRFATERYWKTARVFVQLPITIVLLAGMTYLGWQEVHQARECLCLNQAEKVRKSPEGGNFSQPYIAAMKKAYAAEPNNFETTYSIGESYRVESFLGEQDYGILATNAMEWFAKGIELDPYDAYNYMRYGMCLDWVDRQDEAGPYFNKADALDPNGYYITAHVGWHYVQIGDYAAARSWFQRSRLLETSGNDIADAYLTVVKNKLLQAATNDPSLALP